MKIEELEKSEYDNTYLMILDNKNLTEDVSLGDVIIRVKIKDYQHFLNVLSEANEDNGENHTIVLEDSGNKYVINGNFAVRI